MKYWNQLVIASFLASINFVKERQSYQTTKEKLPFNVKNGIGKMLKLASKYSHRVEATGTYSL